MPSTTAVEAHPPALGCDVQVVALQRQRARRAVRLARVDTGGAVAPPGVLLVGDSFEMVGVDAPALSEGVAQVIDDAAVRDRADPALVGQHVS